MTSHLEKFCETMTIGVFSQVRGEKWCDDLVMLDPKDWSGIL